jgi:hypothetical protein
MRRLLAAFAVLAGCVAAQVDPPYPGQDPSRPQQQRGSGIPNPFPHKKTSTKEPLAEASGVIVDLTNKTFSITTSDRRVMIFQLLKETKFTDGAKTMDFQDLGVGDELKVESRSDPDGNLLAVNVNLVKRGAPAKGYTPPPGPVAAGTAGSAAAENERPEPAPTVLQSASADEERPALKRGKPKKLAHEDDLEKEVERDETASVSPRPVAAAPGAESAAAEPTESTVGDTSAPPVPVVKDADPYIAKAREAVKETIEKLPNFFCDQFTTRYTSPRKPVDWRPVDLLSAKVIYEDGKERYENQKINNRPVKDLEKSGNGSTSTGEFGSWLADVFSPGTAAKFQNGTNTTLNGRDSRVYSFEVEQEHSHWKIMPTSQYYYPAYNGSVWVDKTTGQTLRIESGAINMPKDFPIDSVETSVDYDYVIIGSKKFLMPVKGEVLSCWRDRYVCDRNVIQFRNYHRFGAESDVKFGP